MWAAWLPGSVCGFVLCGDGSKAAKKKKEKAIGNVVCLPGLHGIPTLEFRRVKTNYMITKRKYGYSYRACIKITLFWMLSERDSLNFTVPLESPGKRKSTPERVTCDPPVLH